MSDTCTHCTAPMQAGICLLGCEQDKAGPAVTHRNTPRYAEGYPVDFSDLNDNERAVFTRRMGDLHV